MRKLFLLIFVFVLKAFGGLTTVNGMPQFSKDEKHFGFYWAVWRAISPEERSGLPFNGGSLVSKRTLRWEVQECESKKLVHQDGETFWYLDPLEWDNEGNLIPVREAFRPGYRYVNLITLTSRHLKGQGAFSPPKRERGESSSDFNARKKAAFDAWSKSASVKGTYGTVTVHSEQKLFPLSSEQLSEGFLEMANYKNLPTEEQLFLKRLHPEAWPIFYDERAHKPHTWKEPSVWNSIKILHTDKLKVRLEWDGCRSDITAVATFPKGGLPPAGPTRPGRPESGNAELTIHFE